MLSGAKQYPGKLSVCTFALHNRDSNKSRTFSPLDEISPPSTTSGCSLICLLYIMSTIELKYCFGMKLNLDFIKKKIKNGWIGCHQPLDYTHSILIYDHSLQLHMEIKEHQWWNGTGQNSCGSNSYWLDTLYHQTKIDKQEHNVVSPNSNCS